MRATATALALAVLGGAISAIAMGCAHPESPVATAPSAPSAPTVVDVASTSTSPVLPIAVAASAPAPAGARAPEGPAIGTVRPGIQRPLNAAIVPFAKYLNAMHNRIHVRFADETLTKLDALPLSDPLNDTKLATRIEVVIDGKSGQLVKASVVAPSGNATFDVFAVDAVQRAAPFGAADPVMWSTDGNVYVHWEFRRDEVFACSTMHTRPYLLDLGAPPP